METTSIIIVIFTFFGLEPHSSRSALWVFLLQIYSAISIITIAIVAFAWSQAEHSLNTVVSYLVVVVLVITHTIILVQAYIMRRQHIEILENIVQRVIDRKFRMALCMPIKRNRQHLIKMAMLFGVILTLMLFFYAFILMYKNYRSFNYYIVCLYSTLGVRSFCFQVIYNRLFVKCV